MTSPGETCCPDCGSHNAVSKAAAWDAAASIPPKTAKRVECLEEIASAARNLVVSSPASPSSTMVCVSVPLLLLDALRDALRDALKGGEA